ncbi:hypothetical protein Clacol_000276 [Clathrus columnatus]|uniref:HECT-type E3 ubiquitin transferase n=1 Tax=Clathrus columnatus TaxID=1419009 RepID=A0AAV4ZYD5_9AGAM|nr:hypothetical protein Clacol_000276 [Clathrus columnatus]
MKIQARSSKKASHLPAETALLIADILHTPTQGLPDVLSSIDVWKWARSDLHCWIKVLNKFDAVLEEIIRDYDIDNHQVKEFTPHSREIVLGILTFERLLLENSTNRKLFNSYDRLSSFLLTSDLDVLVADLLLLLRPAQQYSAQASVSHTLNVSIPRLQALTKRWLSPQENGLEFVDMASEKKISEVESLPSEASEVKFTFYRKPRADEKHASTEGDVFDAQQKKAAPVMIQLGPMTLSSKSAMETLVETVESYGIPNDEKLELLFKIRIAKALSKGSYEDRVKLVTIRLLAIAIFCLTQSENSSQSSIFVYEPDLVAQLAEFLHIDRGIPTQVQTAALIALDGIGRIRGKIQEILTAVNAGVNHGILMSLLRRTVTDIANPSSNLPNTLVEALISFVTFIATHASGGNMVVGAGLIPMLVQLIENKNHNRLSIVSKAMQLVDNVVYGFPNAFQLFCNAQGVQAVVLRIKDEVDFDIAQNEKLGHIAFSRANVLKHTLRSLHRMMQTSGTSEGLRGLIDTSIINSIKQIIEHRSLFGSSVLPIAIHVMSTFVHNEPTSLTILQEAKLPDIFYDAIQDSIEPSIEVIQAIINAIGALCLNQTGQEQLQSRPRIIPSIFCVFKSEKHARVLSEKENAVVVGSAIDELIRHHPSLKTAVFDAILSLFKSLDELGNSFTEDKGTESFYRLVITVDNSQQDIKMETTDPLPASSSNHSPEIIESEHDQGKPEIIDNPIVLFIDVVCRFLEGLFQYSQHCRDFMQNTDGLDNLCKLVTIPGIPYNYASTPASDALVQVLRMMTEVAPSQTTSCLIKQVKLSLENTRDFWEPFDGGSKLHRFIEISSETELVEANTVFYKLTALYNRVTLLADLFSTTTFGHGRSNPNMLSACTGIDAAKILPDLGALHRACIWENIVLKGSLAMTSSTAGRISGILQTEVITSAVQANAAASDPDILPGLSSPSEDPKAKDSSKKDSPEERNAKALKYIATQVPASLTPLFQAVVRLPTLYSRRNPDAAQRKHAMSVTGCIAEVALRHLQTRGSDDMLASYAYWTVMMGLITVLLFEERASNNNLHTMLLVIFKTIGGIDAILHICKHYVSAIERITVTKTSDRSETEKQELVHVFGGLKVALHLLHFLVSSKPLFDSPQTVLLINKEKKNGDIDYFEPHNFLVKLRLAILPFIRELWEAPWLIQAPLSVCKSVVQTMLVLMGGDNEEIKGENGSEPATSAAGGMSGIGFLQRHLSPDENAVGQLCDMGFPRSAAERALIRMRNNVGAAAEYLLGQPLLIRPDPEPEETELENPVDVEPGLETDTMDNVQGFAEGLFQNRGKSREVAEEIKTSEEWKDELDRAREFLKERVGRRSLQLLDEHPSLIFDIKGAFVGSPEGYSGQALPLIIQDIKDFSPGAYDIHEQSLAIRCRLLAIIFNEMGSLETRLSSTAPGELMDVLIALLLAHPEQSDIEATVSPKWLSSLLLVIESLLITGDEPLPVVLPRENEEICVRPISNEPTYPSARQQVFLFCLKLLSSLELPQDESISVLRLLLYLTRDYGMAQEFVKLNGIALLLDRFKMMPKDASGCQVYVILLLRHVIEDQPTVELVMKQEIKRWFSQPRTKISDVGNFIRGTGSIALRDPKVFVKVTESMCELVTVHPSVHHITLRPSPPDGPQKEAVETHEVMLVDDPRVSNLSENTLESAVHHLAAELLRVGKSAVTASFVLSGDDAKTPVAGPIEPTTAENETRSNYFYACFLMQCLTELLFSYNACKVAFLAFTKKKGSTPSKDAGSKHRLAVLNFLLTELISFGGLDTMTSAGSKRRGMLCNWAMSVVAALCVQVGDSGDSRELATEFVNVRRLVLEALSRAIRDPVHSETMDERYGRLLALVDLTHRLLTVKVGSGSVKPSDDNPLHMAKLMLEKNFVAILTGALAEVDLNYPNVRGLLTAILRPLESLSKIAIKMGRVSDKGKEKQDVNINHMVSDSSSEDGIREDEREETPDLYRNSALGIYGGEMDDSNNYQSDDEMDENEDVAADEMEFGEEDASDSENTSTDSDEEIPHDDMGVEPHSSDEDGWNDEDDDDDDDIQDDDDDDEDDDDDDGDGLDIVAGDQEIAWQVQVNFTLEDQKLIRSSDIAATDGEIENVQQEDMDDEEAIEGIPMMAPEEIEEVVSEDEEIAEDIGMLEHADLVPSDGEDAMGLWFGELTRDGHHQFFAGPPIAGRRRRTTNVPGDFALFGPRHNVNSREDNLHHPLLVDPTTSGSTAHPLVRNSNRRNNRGNQAMNAYSDILQTIEDLVSGGALQLFQQLMNSGRGGGTGELHIDLAPMNAQIVPGLDRTSIPGSSWRTSGFPARTDRAPRIDSRGDIPDFTPLPTIQRWIDEARIIHGKFLTERMNKVCNHVTLRLLPPVLAAAKEEKAKKENEGLSRLELSHTDDNSDLVDGHEELPGNEGSHTGSEEQDGDSGDMGEPLIQFETDDDAVMEDGSNVISMENNVGITGLTVQGTGNNTDLSNEDRQASPSVPGPSTVADVSAPSISAQRVTVSVHGNSVDITDTGIDPTFLEALPDEMREEVLNQHFRERRTAMQQRPADSQISPEFLDALPPELRAEILQQERHERRVGEPAPTTASGPPVGPADIDTASFIASLDPQLRHVVLMDQEDGFLQTLPSYLIAEANVYRENAGRRVTSPPMVVPVTNQGPMAEIIKKSTTSRDSIQLLDKTGLTTLVRLLFFPQLPRKSWLLKIFGHLCENTKTRSELLNLLLNILHDGTGDVAAVDKSFSQLSFRNRAQSQLTPKAPSKSKAPIETPASWQITSESVPNLVVQRALEALTYIVSANELASRFFLTEQEIPLNFKRSSSKKGKGKEKQQPQTYYPIVSLLALLDPQTLLRIPTTMDSLAGLLSTITRPLTTLKEAEKEVENVYAGDNPQVSSVDGATNVQPIVTSQPSPGEVAENTEDVATRDATGTNKPESGEVLQKVLPLKSPVIPHSSLRLIVNILTVGECSGRTFQSTLALIQHLSYLPDARDTIASELRSRAQELGINIYDDLDALHNVLQKDSPKEDLPATIATKFSPASSDQAKLLRILKTIDYMYSSKATIVAPQTSSSTTGEHQTSDEEKVHAIYESFRFAPLWRRLGDCLAVIEENSDVEHMATVLLPLIESLMVVCKYVGSKTSTSTPLRNLRASASPRASNSARDTMEDLFISFTDSHRKVLNLMVRNNPSLMSGSFALLVQNPRVLDFDNKRNYFYQQLRRRPHSREHHGTLQLNVRRPRVFEDSFQYLQRKSGEQIKHGKLSVRFYEEEGVDAGGVTREWFQILARQMFDPNYALFQPCAADKLTYQPNRASWVNPEHLSFFKFVGRIIGKAIFDSRLLEAYFARSLYRQLLGKPVDYKDVEWVDPEYYNSLVWILENDPTPLDLTFSTEAVEFGVTHLVELKENGANVPVTQENKREFVQLSAHYRLTKSIKEQIDALLGGFYDIIPKDLISIFNEQELELLISGTPDIDIDEWRAATEYNGYTSSDPVIVWWWRALKSFNRDERAKVLSFATGTSRVPLGGFGELQGVQGVQRFSIHKAYGEPDRLPQAHTCFNQIDLPQYSSYEMLRKQLLLAINEGGEGFGFA